MWAVVPVKGFDAPKQRLSAVLSSDERAGLTRAMLSDLLATLQGVNGLAGVLVISGDERVLGLAAKAGVTTLRETLPSDYNAAVAQAARHLADGAAAGMLHLPGDVPFASAVEVESVLAAHGSAPAVTLVPARDGDGTNCLALSPPELLTPAFGPGSCDRHADLARAAGIEPVILDLPGIGLDIDTPGDLVLCCERAGAEETTRFLRENDICGRLPQTPA